MKKLTEMDNIPVINEGFQTPAQAIEESNMASKDPVEIIDAWVEKYLNNNGLPKNKREYQPEAGTSIMNYLDRYGYKIVKK